MAREVVHEVYQPRLERVDVPEILTGSGLGIGKERFPLKIKNGDLPHLQLDAQLIRYIHCNAVSNACKYGKAGGRVTTTLGYDRSAREFVLLVSNEPGGRHEELLAIGENASDFVFAQGCRLPTHLKAEHVSTGDGAWIMQKWQKL